MFKLEYHYEDLPCHMVDTLNELYEYVEDLKKGALDGCPSFMAEQEPDLYEEPQEVRNAWLQACKELLAEMEEYHSSTSSWFDPYEDYKYKSMES